MELIGFFHSLSLQYTFVFIFPTIGSCGTPRIDNGKMLQFLIGSFGKGIIR